MPQAHTLRQDIIFVMAIGEPVDKRLSRRRPKLSSMTRFKLLSHNETNKTTNSQNYLNDDEQFALYIVQQSINQSIYLSIYQKQAEFLK